MTGNFLVSAVASPDHVVPGKTTKRPRTARTKCLGENDLRDCTLPTLPRVTAPSGAYMPCAVAPVAVRQEYQQTPATRKEAGLEQDFAPDPNQQRHGHRKTGAIPSYNRRRRAGLMRCLCFL